MRLVVMAYHNVGYLCLKELISRRENILAVVTHKDDPEEIIWFKSVKELAEKHNLPVYMPYDVNENKFLDFLRKLEPDLIFSFMFRKLFKEKLLKIPRYGCINLHPSLLPKYRGRCPLNWILINGEKTAGITLHYMEVKADSGNIIGQKQVSINNKDDIVSLHKKIALASLSLFKEIFPLIKRNKVSRIPQIANEATYFQGRGPKDGRIDWNKAAVEINNFVRALTYPFPGAFAFYRDKKIIIWETAVRKKFIKNEPGLKDIKEGQILNIDNKKVTLAAKKGVLLVEKLQIDALDDRGKTAKEVLDRYNIRPGARLR